MKNFTYIMASALALITSQNLFSASAEEPDAKRQKLHNTTTPVYKIPDLLQDQPDQRTFVNSLADQLFFCR